MMTDAKFIDVDGLKTRYFDKGNGEILLLVHGSHMGTPDAGLLQALGLKNVHVIGHSRGGYVVARLTLDHPDPGRAPNQILRSSGGVTV